MEKLTEHQETKSYPYAYYFFLGLAFLASCSGIAWYFYTGQPEGVENLLIAYFPALSIAGWGIITGDNKVLWSAAIPAVLFNLFVVLKNLTIG